jgi:predicted transcriptional regulator
MCPNCGMTINLENRREIDFGLIKNATGKHPRTFTELLHITKLSRKTLNSRLQKLCKEGVLIKDDGGYRLNGSLGIEDKGKDFVNGFLNGFHNKKLRTGLMLIAFLLFSSASGHVLAMLFTLPHIQTYQEPVFIGNFTMALDVNNVVDLYAWQVAIAYSSSQLKVLEITSGGFVGDDFPFFLNSTDSREDLVLIAGLLQGAVPGKNGSGRLATIVFGYFTENYDTPQIVPKELSETLLLDPEGQSIPIKDSTLTLAIVAKP